MKIYEPQKTEIDHESVQVKMPLLFTVMHNIDCMQLVTHVTIHDSQIL